MAFGNVNVQQEDIRETYFPRVNMVTKEFELCRGTTTRLPMLNNDAEELRQAIENYKKEM